MAGDKSKKPSRKTGTNKNKRPKKAPVKADKEATKTGPAIPRLDFEPNQNGGLQRMPSNAPTMAIAPSDYEHIFHEGAAPAHSPPPTPPVQQPTTPTEHEMRRTQTRSPQQDFTQSPQALAPVPQAASFEVQVTPDGYTLLGQPPLDMNSNNARRNPLPSHVVRANNQFSRAALARVAKYLASRSEF